MMIVMIFFSGCGTTKVVVRNGTERSNTSISVTTNNPTSVNASPNVVLDLKNPIDTLKLR